MNLQKYRLQCTLSFGDIYIQILAWLGLIFLSVASGVALWASSQQLYAIAAVALVVVMSLPFLLFAFVTTLLNHIEVKPVDDTEEAVSDVPSVSGQQTPQPAS